MRTGNLGKLYSLDARGKFGYSGGFGRIAFGYTRLGFYNWFCGIYQKKYFYGKPFISRSKFYRPTNPQTELQQAWRGVVASGWDEWNTFTAEKKEEYKKIGDSRRITGPNAFMSEWLNSHKNILA